MLLNVITKEVVKGTGKSISNVKFGNSLLLFKKVSTSNGDYDTFDTKI